MPSIATRAATPADIPAIAAIYGASVVNATASFEVVPPDEAEMTRRMSALISGGYPYFVAERDGVIVGYGYVGPYHARAGYRNTVEDSIYLAPEAQGQGIGGVLLRALIDASVARGYRQMIAVIGGSAEASMRLHKAAGFTLVGTLKDVGYKHGRWLDSLIMQRALGPGAASPPST